MVRDVTPFVAVKIPPWMDERLIGLLQEEGLTREEAIEFLRLQDENPEGEVHGTER